MNFPDFTFWSHLLATVGLEVCCLAVLGFAAQRLFRPAHWQRAIWQMTVICLLLLPVSEWTGLGRGAAGILFGQKRVVEKAPASVFAAGKSELAGGPVKVKLNRPPEATRPPVWWPGWVWLAGTVIILGRMAAAQGLLLAMRLRREKISTPSLRERVVSVANHLGLRRKVRLLLMPSAISPMAFGIWRPGIGLPPGFEAKFSVTEQEAVLAHELAHLAAMDPLWFLLADFASALLWWHPLAWWARRSLHVSAELAADEAAALVPDGPGALAKCLVALGKEMTTARGWGWVGINGRFRSKLGKRVERLTRMSGGASRPSVSWAGAAAKTAATFLIVPAVVLLFASFQSARAQKADSWRAELRQSWINSPGALLLLAALDDVKKPEADISHRLQDAKLLYEMGRLDQSEALLTQVLKDDPSNRTAPYYLDLIKEARFMEQARKRQGSPPPAGSTATNPVSISKERQRILSKLQNITLNEVNYDLPLKEVVAKLRTESQQRDPEGLGVNFMINQNVQTGGAPAADNSGAPQRQDIGSEVTIQISPPLKNLRLVDVLDAIIIAADRPICYTVKDFAVVFSPKPPESALLYTKIFRVNPRVFAQGLKKAFATNLNPGTSTGGSVTDTNETLRWHEMARTYFTAAGARLDEPGKTVFINDRLGEVLVRATQQDLEIIQHAIEPLNLSPPQVLIEAKFVELSQEDVRGLGFNWSLGNTPTNHGASGLPGGNAPSHQGPGATANPSGIFPGPNSPAAKAIIPTLAPLTGIMTDPQFRVAINAIEQRPGTAILAAPKVTTESGRQAHLAVLDGNGEGVTLDVIAEVGPDGFSIALTAIPTIKAGGQTWQVSAFHKLWDGQTLVLGGAMTNQPPGAQKVRMVFITPIIIDPAGNRVHGEEEISKRPGIPAQ